MIKRIIKVIIFLLILPIMISLLCYHIIIEVYIGCGLVWFFTGKVVFDSNYIQSFGISGMFTRRVRKLFTTIDNFKATL